MINPNVIPTIAERDTLAERVGVALHIARFGRWPGSKADIEAEISRIVFDAAIGAGPGLPLPSRAEVIAWLKMNSIAVPPRDEDQPKQ